VPIVFIISDTQGADKLCGHYVSYRDNVSRLHRTSLHLTTPLTNQNVNTTQTTPSTPTQITNNASRLSVLINPYTGQPPKQQAHHLMPQPTSPPTSPSLQQPPTPNSDTPINTETATTTICNNHRDIQHNPLVLPPTSLPQAIASHNDEPIPTTPQTPSFDIPTDDPRQLSFPINLNLTIIFSTEEEQTEDEHNNNMDLGQDPEEEPNHNDHHEHTIDNENIDFDEASNNNVNNDDEDKENKDADIDDDDNDDNNDNEDDDGNDKEDKHAEKDDNDKYDKDYNKHDDDKYDDNDDDKYNDKYNDKYADDKYDDNDYEDKEDKEDDEDEDDEDNEDEDDKDNNTNSSLPEITEGTNCHWAIIGIPTHLRSKHLQAIRGTRKKPSQTSDTMDHTSWANPVGTQKVCNKRPSHTHHPVLSTPS